MKSTILLILNIIFFTALLLFSTVDSFAQKEGLELVWSDEFDGTELDTTKWRHRGLGSRRGGMVIKEATLLDGDGHLMITTTIVDSNNYYVGMIGTDETYNTTYGYFEARVKFGKRLSWDSFWMQTNTAYDAGPTLETGAEIDICEYTGGVKRISTGWDNEGTALYDTLGYEVNHNIYWGDASGVLKSWGSHSSIVNNVTDYVKLAVKWTKKRYVFYVNDILTHSTTKGVSGIDEYIILSVEPDFWKNLPDSIQNGAIVQDTFWVDYVRVYQKIPTGIEDNSFEFPKSFELKQNYPNPFNPTTIIKYSIPVGTKQALSLQPVQLKIYDVLGKKVATLVNQQQKSGNYKIQFDASSLPSGIYFYRIVTSDYSKTMKMMLVK